MSELNTNLGLDSFCVVVISSSFFLQIKIMQFDGIITVSQLDQYTLKQLSGGGALIRTALWRIIHLAHTVRLFKCTTTFFR